MFKLTYRPFQRAFIASHPGAASEPAVYVRTDLAGHYISITSPPGVDLCPKQPRPHRITRHGFHDFSRLHRGHCTHLAIGLAVRSWRVIGRFRYHEQIGRNDASSKLTLFLIRLDTACLPDHAKAETSEKSHRWLGMPHGPLGCISLAVWT